jgi:hypothetical protein
MDNNKYINSVVYKIYCKDKNINDIYIGSTANFKHRCRDHKNNCKNINSEKYNFKLYKFIRENGGFDNFIFEIIKKFSFENKRELEAEEDKYILELNSTLNFKRASRNKKQWHEDNKEKLKEKKKQFYEKNSEKIKEKSKQYYENNKEKYAEYQKQYNEKNKEKIKEERKIKTICQCGSVYNSNHKNRHEKTQKHQTYDFLNSIETKYSKMIPT